MATVLWARYRTAGTCSTEKEAFVPDLMDAGVLTVPTAAITALAVLTSSPLVRVRLNGVSDGLPAVLVLMQLPYATSEVCDLGLRPRHDQLLP
jgi:hypothetical protein